MATFNQKVCKILKRKGEATRGEIVDALEKIEGYRRETVSFQSLLAQGLATRDQYEFDGSEGQYWVYKPTKKGLDLAAVRTPKEKPKAPKATEARKPRNKVKPTKKPVTSAPEPTKEEIKEFRRLLKKMERTAK